MWIQSYSGRKVFPLDLTEDQIVIADIAHALSLICRFNGHTIQHYSVAEHSVRCMQNAKRLGYGKLVQYACLMHDTPEAYLSDIAGPIKKSICVWEKDYSAHIGYADVEDYSLEVILNKYNIVKNNKWISDKAIWEKVKDIDYKMLVTEGRDLLVGGCKEWGAESFVTRQKAYYPFKEKIVPMSALEAEKAFLEAFISYGN